ncbi:DUF5994 family protein [Amycolatopsis sp. NPDC021455]|uniref:DUF5994 family protein n=1 Tax=Amycolatopsis sp. NPDC021455 TaxID=3154901 RepID=UPI0033D72053
MSSGPNTSTTALRLRLEPAVPAPGLVDGAWWPYSRDLHKELPALLAALSTRLTRIDRVIYHVEDWPPPHRRLIVGAGVVRLEGFRSQPPASVTVIAWGGQRLVLQVVPPETAPDVAREAFRTVSDASTAGGSRSPAPA